MLFRSLGLVRGNSLALPLTQEQLADTIGFSLVHTNKTLKNLRRSGAFKWNGSTLEGLDEEKLIDLVGHLSGVSGVRPFL